MLISEIEDQASAQQKQYQCENDPEHFPDIDLFICQVKVLPKDIAWLRGLRNVKSLVFVEQSFRRTSEKGCSEPHPGTYAVSLDELLLHQLSLETNKGHACEVPNLSVTQLLLVSRYFIFSFGDLCVKGLQSNSLWEVASLELLNISLSLLFDSFLFDCLQSNNYFILFYTQKKYLFYL